MAARRVSTADLLRLREYITQKALTCIHAPEGLLQSRFVIPTYDQVAGADDHSKTAARSATGAYLQMYDWDACSFSVDAWKIGIEGLPFEVVANFLALQQENGYIPRTVSPGRIWDAGDCCKPFLAQTLVQELRRTKWKDIAKVEPMLPALEKFLQYYRQNRQHESGLFRWRNVLETGFDNIYTMLGPHEAAKDEDQTCVRYPESRLLAPDLSSYLVGEFYAFATLARRCGRKDWATEYKNLARATATKIEERLFDASLNMYVHLDPNTEEPIRLRSVSGLVPVLLGIATPERTMRCISTNILNPEEFLRAYGIASMSASEPLSNQAPRGTYGRAIVCNWNGPVWVLPNAFTVRLLLKLKMRKEARNVALRVIAAMIKDLNETGVLHENYDANTGKSLWAPQFMSWNLLALELIDEALTGRRPARRR